VKDSKRKPLDLTQSILRSMSPIHQQYIRNQGIKASFSLSLVTHDNLWGILSCHNKEPKYIPQNVRLQCENLSQLFSWHLYAKEEQLYFDKHTKAEKDIDLLLEQITPQKPIVQVFQENKNAVLDIMQADGFFFFSENEIVSIGETPEIDTIRKLAEEHLMGEEIRFATDNLLDHVDDISTLNNICGCLLIQLIDRRNFFTGWFRKEKLQVEKWVGNKDEQDQIALSKKERLTPRTSFTVHEREIRNHSKKWGQTDFDMAARFSRVFLAYALDIQERMQQNMAQLVKNDRQKNEFLATLAHELRNPLAPISAGVSLLEKKDNPDVREKVVTTVKKQILHMTRMINDLLEVSRITQGKVTLDHRLITVEAVLRDAIEICNSLIQERQHKLELNLPEEELWLNGDETRLSQIFANIINNAAKYSDEGGLIKISVEKDAKKDEVIISIKDNGKGIPEEKLDQIFTMFTQVDANSPHTKGGLGIGLTLVEKLVKLHNGEITAESHGENKGSTFEVRLPLSTPVQMREEIPEDKSKCDDVQQKIMIVDDHADILMMYEMLLEDMGYDVITAKDGAEAIAQFGLHKPDVALLDIGLPDIDGFELCKKLKESDPTGKAVFISQSGWGSQKHVKKALEAGFIEHFVKPLDPDLLKKTLSKYK
jgi:light-regulated signal transduction histidine kinase (bacteriophytochrome)